MLRTKRSRVAKRPKYGPPNDSGMPKLCPSATATSAPSAPGERRMPSASASAVTLMGMAPTACVIAAIAPRSSTIPKKFGYPTTTPAGAGSSIRWSAARSTRPSEPNGISSHSRPASPSKYVRTTCRYCGGSEAAISTRPAFGINRLAISTASAVAVEPS